MKVAAKSDLGRVRTTNEDGLLIDERLGLLMVADGMGGHAGGEVASAMAIATITASVQGPLRGSERCVPPAVLLQAAIHAADEAIWTRARTARPLRGMGTTVVLVLCQGAQVHLAHVGDSRAYLLQDGRLRQLTEDHSVVARLRQAGQLTPRQARTHPQRHQITRSVGSGKAVADLTCVTWHPGDSLLLCSDGLTTMVADRQLQALILQAGEDVQAACEALVARANANGGEDNITVVLAQCA
jgi:serine/threonine protein phosphatase PrpC